MADCHGFSRKKIKSISLLSSETTAFVHGLYKFIWDTGINIHQQD